MVFGGSEFEGFGLIFGGGKRSGLGGFFGLIFGGVIGCGGFGLVFGRSEFRRFDELGLVFEGLVLVLDSGFLFWRWMLFISSPASNILLMPDKCLL